MKSEQYTLQSEVWLYPGETASWHFASVSKEVSAELKERFGEQRRGWGSLPVMVTLGQTSWKTSVFPDKKSGTYLLPLKADIRRKEGVRSGDRITFTLQVLV